MNEIDTIRNGLRKRVPPPKAIRKITNKSANVQNEKGEGKKRKVYGLTTTGFERRTSTIAGGNMGLDEGRAVSAVAAPTPSNQPATRELVTDVSAWEVVYIPLSTTHVV